MVQKTGAFTYANKDDANIIVRKPNGLGWTVNWSATYAYLLQAGILAIAFGLLSLFS